VMVLHDEADSLSNRFQGPFATFPPLFS
jgi:hypothetical protein